MKTILRKKPDYTKKKAAFLFGVRYDQVTPAQRAYVKQLLFYSDYQVQFKIHDEYVVTNKRQVGMSASLAAPYGRNK